MMGVPEADRVEVRRLADLVVHREPGVHDVPQAGMEAALDLVVYYADMVEQRKKQPDRRPHQRAAGRGDRRRPAHRRGDHRLPLPDGRRRQRDHDQAARARAVPPGPAPRAVRPGLRRPRPARRPGRAVDRGDAALRHLQPDARAAPARRTSSCTARSRRPAPSCCSCSARPTATTGCSPTRTATTSSATRTRSPSCSASAAAGTSAWAPTWPGSRRRSRCASWSAGSAGSRSTTTPAGGCTRSTCAASPSVPVTDGGALMGKYAHPDRRPAVVTGASSGIGAATALALAAAGHPVALGARRTDKCDELAAADPRAGRRGVRARRSTSPTTSSVEAFAEGRDRRPRRRRGRGQQRRRRRARARSHEVDTERFARELDLNLVGAHRLVRAFVPGHGRAPPRRHRLRLLRRRRAGAAVHVVVRRRQVGPRGHGARDADGARGHRRPRLDRPARARPGARWAPTGTPTTRRFVLNQWVRFGLARHPHFLKPAALADAITTVVSAPRGVHLNLIEVIPEAPLEDR